MNKEVILLLRAHKAMVGGNGLMGPNCKIGFCSGVFDLVHQGHYNFFEDCRKHCLYLFVMVGSDEYTKERKGLNRPIVSQLDRLYIINKNKDVEWAFPNIVPETQYNTWENLERVFIELKPHIYFVNEDAFDIPSRQKLCSNHNIEMKIMKRKIKEGLTATSTTKIIEKIQSEKTN